LTSQYKFLFNKFADKSIPKHFSNQFKVQKGTSKSLQAAHQHDFIQLWYVVSGSFRHSINGVEYTQSAGDFIAVPPNIPHQIDTREAENLEFFICNLGSDLNNITTGEESKNLLFELTYFRPLVFLSNTDTPFVQLRGDTAKQAENIFYELLEEYNRDVNYSPLAIRSILIKLLTLITREYTRTMPQHDKETFANYRKSIQLALDYTDKHFTENISIKDISRIALISVRSFSRIFSEITGTTFSTYIRHLRIHKAKQLLADTDLSFASVCYECGFFDLSHFFRTFKTQTGLTPGAFRKKHQYTLTLAPNNKEFNIEIKPRNTTFWDGYNNKQPFLAKIFELEGSPFPSIWELVSDTPYSEKEAVLYYLKRASVIAHWDIAAIDVISGKKISIHTQCMTDGEYYWWSDLSHYVERYNLELPQAFIDKCAAAWGNNK
jgi:AraC-like DNA-binding protein/mannose-6-phosphate isomerase-like protein (cupin superfamily)